VTVITIFWVELQFVVPSSQTLYEKVSLALSFPLCTYDPTPVAVSNVKVPSFGWVAKEYTNAEPSASFPDRIISVVLFSSTVLVISSTVGISLTPVTVIVTVAIELSLFLSSVAL